MISIRAVALFCSLAFGATAAMAQQTEDFTFNGDLSGNAISGTLSLQVANGQVSQGSGTLNVPAFMLYDSSLVLITPSTPGNYPDSGYPVNFRDNSGGDIAGDTSFPLTAAGLVFNVGTTVPQRSAYPLFNIGLNPDGSLYALFDGTVNGNVLYAKQGTIVLSPLVAAVPGPVAGAGLVSLLGLGGLLWNRRRLVA